MQYLVLLGDTGRSPIVFGNTCHSKAAHEMAIAYFTENLSQQLFRRRQNIAWYRS